MEKSSGGELVIIFSLVQWSFVPSVGMIGVVGEIGIHGVETCLLML